MQSGRRLCFAPGVFGRIRSVRWCADQKGTVAVAMVDQKDKPTLPEGYKVPEVWQPPAESGGSTWGSINRPTAGARFEQELPRGEHPIQMYSLGTPNGVKVGILFEELGIDYDAYSINIMKGEQFGSGFTAINPNSKIPAVLDYSADPPIRMFESGSILLQMAEKYGKFIPTDPHGRAETINWLMWQMGTAPYIGGGFGHFYNYAPVMIEYAIDRFTMEVKRILDVLDKQLEGKEYVIGDEYTIADIAIFPWIVSIPMAYKAGTFIGFDDYKNIARWLTTMQAKPAVQRGMRVNGFTPDAIPERHSPDDFNTTPASS